MRRCSKCDVIKEATEFYGRSRQCAECVRAYRREWSARHPGYSALKRKEWAEKNPERAREIERRKYERRKAKRPAKVPRPPALTMSERKRRYEDKHPLKAEARKIYRYALRMGRLEKQPCEVCGEFEVDGHHDDYLKPLEVRWLCRKHHAEHHQKARGRE